MPRIALVVFVVALVLPFTAQATSPATATPALRLLARTPVVVKGLRFDPGERVRVVALAGTTSSVRFVTASSAGTFRLAFTDIHLPGCRQAFVVQAHGATGNYAWLRCRRGGAS